ncbi:MAG: thiamine pyrophosphate-binding protein [Bacillota bacterium]|nr:thiamine pyrophosphate-binding protein [Bacillota bacterium]
MKTGSRPNGGDLFIDILRKRGVSNIYCCPGTTEVSIIDATVNCDDINFILFPFEGSAVAAADGHSRVTGKPQVAMLHANVGLANGICQIYSAKMSNSPVVVINVIKPRNILAHGGITSTTDEQEMVKQYMKWDWLCLRSEELAEDLNRAFQMAIKPPMGPTLLVIPQDVLEAPASEKSVYTFPRENVSYKIAPADEEIDRAAEILAESDFPLIIAGSGVGRENCIEQVKALADLLGAGVSCDDRRSFYHNGYPTGESNFLGPYRTDIPAAEKADVILVLGTKLFVEFNAPGKPDIPEKTRLIHQHDDIAEIDKLYGAEVPLCGSTAETVNKLYSRLELLMKEKPGVAAARRKVALELSALRRKEVEAFLSKEAAKKPIRVSTLVEHVSSFMDQKTTVVIDTPTSDAHFIDYLERPDRFSCYVHCHGGLGWGTGAALGVKWGNPGRRVICVVGDGSLLFGVQSLWVAFKYRVPVVFLVINNQRYAAVRKGLLNYKGNAVKSDTFPGTDISGIDYTGLARSFSVQAERVEAAEDLSAALDRALNMGEPYLLEVMVDPDDF